MGVNDDRGDTPKRPLSLELRRLQVSGTEKLIVPAMEGQGTPKRTMSRLRKGRDDEGEKLTPNTGKKVKFSEKVQEKVIEEVHSLPKAKKKIFEVETPSRVSSRLKNKKDKGDVKSVKDDDGDDSEEESEEAKISNKNKDIDVDVIEEIREFIQITSKPSDDLKNKPKPTVEIKEIKENIPETPAIVTKVSFEAREEPKKQVLKVSQAPVDVDFEKIKNILDKKSHGSAGADLVVQRINKNKNIEAKTNSNKFINDEDFKKKLLRAAQRISREESRSESPMDEQMERKKSKKDKIEKLLDRTPAITKKSDFIVVLKQKEQVGRPINGPPLPVHRGPGRPPGKKRRRRRKGESDEEFSEEEDEDIEFDSDTLDSPPPEKEKTPKPKYKPPPKEKAPIMPEIPDEMEIIYEEDDDEESHFDKHFAKQEYVCEVDSSYDSDSSDDGTLFTHFMNLKDKKIEPEPQPEPVTSNQEEKPQEPVQPPPTETVIEQIKVEPMDPAPESMTIQDLMKQITAELPTWNIHSLPDSEHFCLAQLETGPMNMPIMRKVIHLDSEFNAKVFVNQMPITQLDGVYNSDESIRQLIYTLEAM